jgi:hypothetical protein
MLAKQEALAMTAMKTIRARIAGVLSSVWMQMFLILAGSFLVAIRGAPYAALLSLLVTLLGGAMFLMAFLQANRYLKSPAAVEATTRDLLRQISRPLRSIIASLLILWLPLWVISATSCCAPVSV